MHSLIYKDSRTPLFQFTIIGAGANGSHFFRNLCQDLRTHMDRPGFQSDPSFQLQHILLVDGDICETKNLGNQVFDTDDIGEKKVISLAERYGEHYNLPVLRYPEYVRDLETLNSLMGEPEYNNKRILYMPVLVGMVDNNATRRLLDEYFHQDEVENLIYIDAGVEGIAGLGDVRNVNESGFSGQIVIGFKYRGEVLLEPVGRVYTNILEDEDTSFPGCGVQIQSAPQRSATNKTAAQLANNVVNNLFHTHGIYQHVINFNAQLCGSSPQLISKETKDRFEALKKGDLVYG
jgi:hypothetical protein